MIEIMLVLALIGLIMGVVVTGLRKRARDGQIQIARMQVRQLAGTLFQHRLANGGECPATNGSDAPTSAESKDPWGRALLMICPGEHDQDGVDVVSLGPDGRPSADDIESWKLQ